MSAPATFEELYTQYHGMVLSLARKAGIPEADVEDAAHNVEFRFWRRGGLGWYDPERLHEPPPEGWKDGKPAIARTATFGSMFRSYVRRSMLGEADRIATERKNTGYPHDWTDPHFASKHEAADVAVRICDEQALEKWLQESCDKMSATRWADYVQLFREVVLLSMQGKQITRDDIASVMYLPPKFSLTKLMGNLQEAIIEAGIDMTRMNNE